MADSYVSTGNTVEQWDYDFMVEYLRMNQFSRYFGSSENAMIQVNEDLQTKPGNKINFSLIRNLSGQGVEGNATLEGNEEELDNRSFGVTVSYLRHAVSMTKEEQMKHPLMRPSSARTVLRNWALDRTRDDVIAAMMSINGTAFASADATARNAWLVDNSDRVLFGNAKANAVSGVWATAAGLVDSTTDVAKGSSVSLMKRMARTATPRIRPIRVAGENSDQEWFVCFMPSLVFRDFKTDSAVQQANRDAWIRGESNPLFTDGDLLWDGVIVREIPEIPVISGVGDSSIDIAPVFFCGAQAVAVGYGARDRTTTDTKDYDFKAGVGIELLRGIKKTIFGKGATDTDDTVDHGMVTGYFAAVADA